MQNIIFPTYSYFVALAFLTMLFCSSSSAQNWLDLPPCEGSDTLNWTNCTGTLTFANAGETYTGDIKCGKADGYGIFTDASGKETVGLWKDGMLNYLGYMRTPGGCEIPKSKSLPNVAEKLTAVDRFGEFKKKCTELGFKSGTEGFGKCVLQLSK